MVDLPLILDSTRCCFCGTIALKTTDGLGVSEETMLLHFDALLSSRAWSLGDWEFGSLFEMVLIDENPSMARSVARIWEPTAPVQPNTAAVDTVEPVGIKSVVSKMVCL